ncbi:hypothetical protein DDB_G0270512 [Dictyostelium discoideum AX4]|uniref:Uncharacterized protein n=1 Tax=Dictyostelium discoideum TaxID=44689 RepID=Q55E27_DICDI|nr:hypothetical protein DDB_G0270512 [Dictyostelium discoideum AX4]EAL72606.1 hypothetical protein DDB_G0270512 [Dictyostelium discoideum AX4]|eukprot:XP_645954.1 hypothetical protein DDB_G0270512 [Dictyostelium discoideum AX4]
MWGENNKKNESINVTKKILLETSNLVVKNAQTTTNLGNLKGEIEKKYAKLQSEINSLNNYINRERNEINNLKRENDRNSLPLIFRLLNPFGALIVLLSDLSGLKSRVAYKQKEVNRMSRELDCLTSQKTLVTQSLSYTEKEIVQFNKTKNCLELSLNGLGIKKTNDENLKFGLELLKIEFGILSVDSDLSRELLEIGRNHVPKYEEKLKILFTENNLTFNLIEN